MITIELATVDDVPAVLASADALVATDAGRYDSDATDLGWAARAGLAYATGAITDHDSLVMVARDGETVIGHVVGRLHGPGSVRPIRVAELESIHVYPEHRGRGVGTQLVDAFVAWAVARGAGRASVTAYAANDAAQRLYVRHGFATRSVIMHRDLP